MKNKSFLSSFLLLLRSMPSQNKSFKPNHCFTLKNFKQPGSSYMWINLLTHAKHITQVETTKLIISYVIYFVKTNKNEYQLYEINYLLSLFFFFNWPLFTEMNIFQTSNLRNTSTMWKKTLLALRCSNASLTFKFLKRVETNSWLLLI